MDPMNQTPPQVSQSPGEGSNMKWMVIVTVIVILLLVGWMFMRGKTPTPMPQEGVPTVGTQTTPTTETPRATGNVDDIISSLESAQVAETLIANAGDNDISLVTSDADAVSGMNTLYNDNEF